jgi:hypothetical protein
MKMQIISARFQLNACFNCLVREEVGPERARNNASYPASDLTNGPFVILFGSWVRSNALIFKARTPVQRQPPTWTGKAGVNSGRMPPTQ